MKRMFLFGVPLDAITLDFSVEKIEHACREKKQLFCITPNPEICLEALKNKSYRHVLKTADLSLPDGIGLLWATGYFSQKKTFRFLSAIIPWVGISFSPLPERVTGTDVMATFLHRFPQRKIFLLGASKKVNEELSRKLRKKGIQIVGNMSASPDPKEGGLICRNIERSHAEVLFVAFGAPRQELWIHEHLPLLKNISVAMGVGGAFDFLSGEKMRAPSFFQITGMEWLYRLLREPQRFKRIFNAVILFPWKVLTSKEIPLG